MEILSNTEQGMRIRFEPIELQVLQQLPEKLRELLRDPDFQGRYLKRLFPKASEDPEIEKQFRELTGRDLIHEKRNRSGCSRKASNRRPIYPRKLSIDGSPS